MDNSSFSFDLQKRIQPVIGIECSVYIISLGQSNTAKISGTRSYGQGKFGTNPGDVPWDQGNIPALLDLCNRVKTFPDRNTRTRYDDDVSLQIAILGTPNGYRWDNGPLPLNPRHQKQDGPDASIEQKRDLGMVMDMIMVCGTSGHNIWSVRTGWLMVVAASMASLREVTTRPRQAWLKKKSNEPLPSPMSEQRYQISERQIHQRTLTRSTIRKSSNG